MDSERFVLFLWTIFLQTNGKSATGENPLVVVENWFEELERLVPPAD